MKKLLLITGVLLIAGITYGQNLQKGALLGLHTSTITLNPGFTMNQYLSFLKEKYIPEFEKNFPGMKIYVMKGKRGECTDCISMLMYFQTEAIRDKYFKPEGEFNDAGQAAFDKLKPILDEDSKMTKPAKDVYTDWIIQ
jgi:hypothetical protein